MASDFTGTKKEEGPFGTFLFVVKDSIRLLPAVVGRYTELLWIGWGFVATLDGRITVVRMEVVEVEQALFMGLIE